MGPFEKYVTCIMAFFIPSIWVTLYQVYSFTSPVLFTKQWTERKEDFFIYGCFSVLRYINEVKDCIFIYNRIFHTYMNKQPILTNQQNYNNFVKVFLLLVVISSGLHEKPRKKGSVTEKVHRRKIICTKQCVRF